MRIPRGRYITGGSYKYLNGASLDASIFHSKYFQHLSSLSHVYFMTESSENALFISFSLFFSSPCYPSIERICIRLRISRARNRDQCRRAAAAFFPFFFFVYERRVIEFPLEIEFPVAKFDTSRAAVRNFSLQSCAWTTI